VKQTTVVAVQYVRRLTAFASFLLPSQQVDMMGTVEAAASLFGSEDPLSDPFTTLGTSPASSQTPTYDAYNSEADSGLGEVDQHTLSDAQND
jgi:hypothetical protein